MLVAGRVAGSITVWHDITQRQRAEEALFQLRTRHGDKLRQLAEIIKTALDDRMQETADVIGNVVDNPAITKIKSSLTSLTTREIEVLTLIAEGNSSKAIASSEEPVFFALLSPVSPAFCLPAL
jgi:DNA-binding NarL/FixJ family response regulator